MKKPNLILIFFFWGLSYGKSQTCNYYTTPKFTEFYNLLLSKGYNPNPPNSTNPADFTYSWNYEGNIYKLPSSPTTSDCELAFGSLENGARLIESLLVMYETTPDKAYLHWAMDLSVHWISMRGIGLNSVSPVAWNQGIHLIEPLFNVETYSPHNPSLIIWSMAHLCHIILIEEHNNLCAQNFDPVLLEKYGASIPTLSQYTTYGLFADWLVHRLVESMDFLIAHFWLGPNQGFRDASGYAPGAINQQSSFGAALFYLGHLSNSSPAAASVPGLWQVSFVRSIFSIALMTNYQLLLHRKIPIICV